MRTRDSKDRKVTTVPQCLKREVETCIYGQCGQAPASPALCYTAHFHGLWSRSTVLLSLPRTGHVPSWRGAFAPATPSARSAFPGSLSGRKYLPIPLFKCHQEKPSPTHRSGLKVAIPTAWPLFIAFQELTNVRSRQAVKARRAEPRLSKA